MRQMFWIFWMDPVWLQGSSKERGQRVKVRRSDDKSGGGSNVFWRWKKGSQSNERRQPLEAGEGKDTDCSLETDFSSRRKTVKFSKFVVTYYSSNRNYKIVLVMPPLNDISIYTCSFIILSHTWVWSLNLPWPMIH